LSDYKNKEWLYEKYVVNRLSSTEIAELCGVGQQTILNWLEKFNIPRRKSGTKRKKMFINVCKNCGKEFEVDMYCKHDPNNKRKFVRCCSKECTSELRSKYQKKRIVEGTFNNGAKKYKGVPRTFIDKTVLEKLYCYEHKKIAEICKELKVKHTTVSRELDRHGLRNVFYRYCPQCGKRYTCTMRSMVDPNSTKFKKFCSRSCFLSSRQQCDTWIESEVSDFLISKGIEFEKQVPIERMTVDFLIKGTSVVIEANGDFWHANPDIYGKEKPLHKIHKRVIEKDKRKLKQLNDLGYVVLTVWENDLKSRKEEVLNKLYKDIKDLMSA
jgi:G:T-mismatch repair DNA endonuclease (very short patch repair protein)